MKYLVTTLRGQDANATEYNDEDSKNPSAIGSENTYARDDENDVSKVSTPGLRVQSEDFREPKRIKRYPQNRSKVWGGNNHTYPDDRNAYDQAPPKFDFRVSFIWAGCSLHFLPNVIGQARRCRA